MSYRQNTGFSPRSSNLSKKDDLSSRNLQQSPNIRMQNIPNNGGDRVTYQNGAYRSQKFPGQLNLDELSEKKEVLNDLVKQFGDKNSKVVFDPYKKVQYSKRLMLLEQEIEGLMRQSYLYATKNPGQRALDYSSLINQKENQVNQLERKISYLESQLRMKDQREQELQKQLEKRFESIRNKNNEIELLKGSPKSYTQNNKYPNEVVKNMAKRLMTNLDNLLKKGNPSPAQLQNEIQSWILGLPSESMLKHKFRSADENWLEDKYKRYVNYLTTEAASVVNNIQNLYTSQIVNLKSNGAPVDYDPKIMNMFGKDGVIQQFFPPEQTIMKTQISTQLSSQPLMSEAWLRSRNYNNTNRVVQIPVQDTRTKALITKLVKEMKKLYTKYPKLASEISPQLSQYLSQQILDVIQVDELDKLVEIVKYKPDVIKVQNVYTFNSEKNRKAEFHLKVLIKALLDEMERIKLKTGVQPEIDEGVISMIRQQIMDVVDVEEILRMYRVVPKIVEVEKVVEQVVEKIVPVPHYVTVQVNNTDVVPVNTVQVVKDTVNVPLQVVKTQPLIQEKLVLGNQYHEKILLKPTIQQKNFETVREIPKLRQVDRVVELPQEVVTTIQVPGPQKIVPMEKTVIQNIIEEKIVPVERVVERIVQVEKIVQKIVQVVRQVPKIVVVQKVVEKLVPQIKYQESKRVDNIVVEKPVQVVCYVQKVVPVERIVQRVVTHPQIVQKIVPIKVIQQVIKEVQIIKEVPIYIKELVVQERIVEKPLPPLIQEVIKPVDQIIEFPVIHQKVRVETEYRKQPIIQREEKLVREAVHLQVPVILTEQKILQVQKPVVQYLKQQYPKEVVRERLIPIETVRDNLIPTPFIVEKVIQKMVEVPRIVEIEKIVQKIVPVPRIVQKIVEVEKIIQKIVQKNIYHTNIQPVEYLKEVPIEVESVVTLQIPQYIYQTKEVAKVVEMPVPVVSEVRTEKVQVKQVQQPPRVVIQRMQVPIEIVKQKLAPMVIQDHVYVELQEQIVVPIQMPIPTTLIEQKLVPVEYVIPLIQTVDKVREKVVEVQVQTPGQVITQDQIIEKLFVQNEVRVVQNQVPYYEQQIQPVEVLVQKIIPMEVVVQQIRQVPTIIQKIVNQVNQVPKIYEVQKIKQVPIKEPQLITIDRIVPKIVTLNKAFAQIVDKLHQFPRLAEEMKEVERRIDNIAVEKHESTDIINSEVMVQKAVIQEKLKEVDKFINVVNESLQVVDRIVEKPTDPIIIYEQKILQVPVIVEKLAERIIVMPQVVEVLKYVYDITEENNMGIAVSQNIGAEEAEYQRLGKNVNKELANLRSLLLSLKGVPQYQNHIGKVDRFLAQFNKFLAYPRLIQIIGADNNLYPVTDSLEQRIHNSAELIVQLLSELQRIRRAHSNVRMQLRQKTDKLVSSSSAVAPTANDVTCTFRDIILDKPTPYTSTQPTNNNIVGTGINRIEAKGTYTDVYSNFSQIIMGGPFPYIGPSQQQLMGKSTTPRLGTTISGQNRNSHTSNTPLYDSNFQYRNFTTSNYLGGSPDDIAKRVHNAAELIVELVLQLQRIREKHPNVQMKLNQDAQQLVFADNNKNYADLVNDFRDIILGSTAYTNQKAGYNNSYDMMTIFSNIVFGTTTKVTLRSSPQPRMAKDSNTPLYGTNLSDQYRNLTSSNYPGSSSGVKQAIREMDEDRSLASAILVDKLITELQRIKTTNPNLQMKLDPEIDQIVSNRSQSIVGSYNSSTNKLIDEYTTIIINQLNSGPSQLSSDQKRMLKQYIQERFELASKMRKFAKDAAKYKQLHSGVMEKYHREQQYNQTIKNRFGEIQGTLNGIISGIIDVGIKNSLDMKLRELSGVIFEYASGADTPVYRLGQLDDERSNRYLRQRDAQILQYKRVIDNLKKELQNQRVQQKSKLVYTDCPVHTRTIRDLQLQILELKRRISEHKCTAISKPEDHTNCNSQIRRLTQQLNRVRIQLNKSREQVRILNIEILRLRIIEKEHMGCPEIIELWKKKLAECENRSRDRNSNKVTEKTEEGGAYGRNYGEYVFQDDSRENSQHSARSNHSRGVYRSAGNYATSMNESHKAISMEQLPQGNSLAGSRQSGGNRTDLMSNTNQMQSPRNIKLDNKQLAFSKKYSSKSGSSEGGSQGLYGTTVRQVRRGNQKQ